MDRIQIKGARTHNLKNIDLDMPRDKLIVITACPARANPRSRSIPCTPKDNAVTWSRCPLMRGNSFR